MNLADIGCRCGFSVVEFFVFNFDIIRCPYSASSQPRRQLPHVVPGLAVLFTPPNARRTPLLIVLFIRLHNASKRVGHRLGLPRPAVQHVQAVHL